MVPRLCVLELSGNSKKVQSHVQGVSALVTSWSYPNPNPHT